MQKEDKEEKKEGRSSKKLAYLGVKEGSPNSYRLFF